MTNEELAREAARKAAEYLDDYGCTNTHVPLVSSSIHPFILKAITSAVEADRKTCARGPQACDLEIAELRRTLGAARTRAQQLEAQLPDGMKNCTILFKECSLGHGWLTAANWVQHGCPTCAVEAARVEEREAILRAVNAIKQRKAASHARAVRARRAAAEACRRSDFETCMEIEQQIRARGKETA